MQHPGTLLLAALILIAALVACGNTSQDATTSGATPTNPPTSTKAPVPTHGIPRIGGLLSDFYGKYGTPHTQGIGNSQTWFLLGGTTILNARPDASGKVTYVSVSGPETWSKAQSFAACAAYMPPGASKFNSIGNLTDYHSSVGDLVLTNAGSGVCTLNIAGA